MIGKLVDRRIDEAGELDLRDRPEALRGEADGKSGDRRLGERRVEDAVRPEALQQPIGGAEDAAVDADILAEHEDTLIFRHRPREGEVDGLDEADFGHARRRPARETPPRVSRPGPIRVAPRGPRASRAKV